MCILHLVYSKNSFQFSALSFQFLVPAFGSRFFSIVISDLDRNELWRFVGVGVVN